MDVILSFLIFMLFCVDYYYVYYSSIGNNKKLNESQKAYIMSIKSSMTLFLLSIFFNIKYFISDDFNSNDFIVIHLGILNLIAYFFMDCVIGRKEYNKYLLSLSGYIHHIIYIVVSVVCIKLNIILPYILFLIEELPTLILSLGKFNSNLRSDNLFGMTFFVTRIVYHIFLIMMTYNYHIIIPIVGTLALGVHIYWFKNWLNKYTLLFKND
jgi:hypothetical protein|uniref:TLC domain-containing protein n=1 Tax=viral metagenome TaxID=1070528 RepID=A0A6C0ALS2_9ZZZZ